ncbi:MAG: hypothetical protein LAO07_07940 [Acidobacteriia bacterium]|nr:hypothetical protein [Terriglobia bacterium]
MVSRAQCEAGRRRPRGFVLGEHPALAAVDFPLPQSDAYSFQGKKEAQVGGPIASVGQRLVLAAAQKIIEQFFEEFSRHVQLADSPVSDVHPPA